LTRSWFCVGKAIARNPLDSCLAHWLSSWSTRSIELARRVLSLHPAAFPGESEVPRGEVFVARCGPFQGLLNLLPRAKAELQISLTLDL
jgi:hypothetical protein